MSRRRRRIAIAVVCLAGAIAALPAGASAKKKIVFIGGPAKWSSTLIHRYGAAINSYLINRVTVNAGDTVVWTGFHNGFHTVDIPKLNGEDLPLLTATGKTVSGVMDAGGNPFWFDDKVPVLSFNTKLFGPSPSLVYNGTTRVDSGLPLGPPKNFAVKFKTPGTYKYFCDVHPGMVGYVVVKPKGKAVPTAAQDAAELRAEEQSYATEAKSVAHTKVPRNQVSLGVSGPGGLEVYAMFPAVLHVKKGATVKFFMSKDSREQHSATFGTVSYLKPIANSFGGSPTPDPRGLYPSDPPGHIVLTAASHGNGFANTGILDRDPATTPTSSSTITFAKPGTYHFICIIHAFMHGTVVVK